MENVKDRIESKVLVDVQMVLMKLNKKIVPLIKPIYAGFTILEFSNLHMYDFHYDTIK